MPQLEPIAVKDVTIHWPRFYEPNILPGDKQRFGCSFDASLLSMEARPFANIKNPSWQAVESMPELSGLDLVVLSSQYRPVILLAEGNRHGMEQLTQLCRFMDAANMPRDWLFKGIKATLLLQPVEWRSEDRPRQHDHPGRALNLMAVQVRYTDLLAAYDKLCERYFADPSYPRRETDARD